MPCSICGIHGHNKKTCGRYNNTMPKNSGFYNDYKQNVKDNWDHAKKEKIKSGRKGAVFQKSPKNKNPFDGYCNFMK